MAHFQIYSAGKKVQGKSALAGFNEESAGIFESLRTYGRTLFRLEDHLDRLAESARTSGFPVPDLRQARRELTAALEAYGREYPAARDLFLRITYSDRQCFVLVGERRHSADFYKTGVALRTSPVRRSLSHASPPEVKTSSYQNAVLASLEPQGSGIYEWVFLDRDGYVTEVRIGNLFAVRRLTGARRQKFELATPPCPGILNGVTRRFVLECASRAGIPVRETLLTRHELYNAAEVFLTNTSWEILPVRELDGRRIGRKVPGAVTAKLHRIFRQQAMKECL